MSYEVNLPFANGMTPNIALGVTSMPRSRYLPEMSRTIARAILVAWMISGYELALAETSAKLPLVAQLWFTDLPTTKPWEAVFRSALGDLGYVEGKSIKIVARYADSGSSRLPTLMNELIALRPDVILVSGNAVRAAMAATKAIPLVSFSMGMLYRMGSSRVLRVRGATSLACTR